MDKLENVVKKESILTRFGRGIYNAAKTVCESTAFKVGAVILAAQAVGGCFRQYFSGYWPPDSGRVQLTFPSDGWGIRAQGNFEGDNSTTEAEVGYQESKSTIEVTGNEASESRFHIDANIRPSNNRSFRVRPVIETLDRRIVTPAGAEESRLEGTFFATDIRWSQELGDITTRCLLLRPYFNQSRESTIVSPIDITQSGMYADGRVGIFSPLLSIEKYSVDVGGSTTDLTELQLGTSVGGVMSDNIRTSIGAYAAHTDDGTDETLKAVVLGDATFVLGNHVLGVDGSYDGDLLSLGVHGSFGGMAPDNAKALNKYIKEMQRLTFLERGIPDSVRENRRNDEIQALQSLEAPAFYLLGARWQHDGADWEAEPAFYICFGGNIPIKGRKLTIGASRGPVFEVYPISPVNGRYGVFAGGKIGEARVDLAYEHVDYESIRDKNLVLLRAVFEKTW